MAVLARASLHMWEEPCISGTNGSGTIFFSGCTMRCVYCQNKAISRGRTGKEVTTERLSEIMLELRDQGAHNINLVTPDLYMYEAREAVLEARKQGLDIPIVWNVSGYENPEIVKRVSDAADIWLADFKYMDEALAVRYSSAPGYPKTAMAALDMMVKTAGRPIFAGTGGGEDESENLLMTKGVIVRHLVLPGHRRNAKDVIRYLYETYGDDIYISIMSQYTPFDIPEDCRELDRKLTKREYEDVVGYAIDLGVRNCFIQEGEAAQESFIPDFDLRGI